MREIKFRAWDTSRRKWSNSAVYLVSDVGFAKLQTDPGVVAMQFTGLRDKNGREIYEGDIIQGCSANYCKLVKWHGTGFKWKSILNKRGMEFDVQGKMPKYDFCEIDNEIEYCVVIGNIYDNPELLQGEATTNASQMVHLP